jgi:NAD(P)-dependent dehydrogenase (short-subunit alcohol dehydrogenase family)
VWPLLRIPTNGGASESGDTPGGQDGTRGTAGSRGCWHHRRRHLQADRQRADPVDSSGESARNGRSDQGTRLTAAVDAEVEQFGRLDIIVANTGIGNNGQTLDKTSEPDRDDMIAVDLSGVWKTLKAGVPRILAGRPVRSS